VFVLCLLKKDRNREKERERERKRKRKKEKERKRKRKKEKRVRKKERKKKQTLQLQLVEIFFLKVNLAKFEIILFHFSILSKHENPIHSCFCLFYVHFMFVCLMFVFEITNGWY